MSAAETRHVELRVVNIAIRVCEALDRGMPIDDLLDEYRSITSRLRGAVDA